MSRFHSYLNTTAKILELYKAGEPFAAFLKKYFAAEKKYGSRDRKQIANLCYCYFRTAFASPRSENAESAENISRKVLTGLFLCSAEPNEILKNLRPEWDEKTHLSTEEKFSMLRQASGVEFSLLNLFPWIEQVSDGIEREKFSKSFLVQPDLFLRIRPGYEANVKRKLAEAGCRLKIDSETCIALPNATRVDEILELNKEAVVQDYSSQRIGEFLKLTVGNIKQPITIWDCCAASGGKSILANDILGNIDLTVSDVRESILINLKKRFSAAGIVKYNSFICDLTSNQQLVTGNYDLIIADVPCSGSGTWARTPEQLSFFKEESIEQYSSLQKKIIRNTISHLKPGGYYLYITCSVFKKENEDNADFIKKQSGFELIKQDVLKGYDKKADTMFASLFRKL